jgi:hypothetical protein
MIRHARRVFMTKRVLSKTPLNPNTAYKIMNTI